ncbi:MJ1255/VC2487 family glycosyltransferase [Methanocaldococcus indicus]|uniref:MJ1255/VC2487 family glycosyltransferase n=1 Tax=Methanocaldococcus indicus TaxID=213231 RepID=UPI003C6D2CE7
MRILISVCGEGFGHTTRCIALGEALKDEHELLYLAYGKSKDFIEKYGFDVVETYPEVKLKGKDGKFDLKSTIFNKEHNPKKAIKAEYKIIKKYNPDLIISDCKYSTVVVGKLFKKPVLCITNQNYTKFKLKTDIVVHPTMKILNIINKRCEKVIIPDFPMPYTICEYNLKFLDNMEFIGPLIRYNVDNVSNDNYVLSVIGGFEYRYKILEKIKEISLKNDLKAILVCGSYEVAKRLRKDLKSEDKKNIKIIPFTTEMDKLMRNAEVIVSHGGHSTIMESLCFGKPLVVIPDLDHPEQNNNAKKVDDLGCGIYLTYNELNHLYDAIEDAKLCRKNAEKMRKLYLKYNGKENIKKIINSFNYEEYKKFNLFKVRT